jgi:hypothetical protein
MTYAAYTKVSVDKTKTEISAMLKKAKATSTAVFEEERRAAIAFEMAGRRIMFHLPLDKSDNEQRRRARWRGLLLCIKAKLESVEAGIESFEDAFLAHVMMPDGSTVGEHTRPRIKAAYESGTMQPLLPAPGAG